MHVRVGGAVARAPHQVLDGGPGEDGAGGAAGLVGGGDLVDFAGEWGEEVGWEDVVDAG